MNYVLVPKTFYKTFYSLRQGDKVYCKTCPDYIKKFFEKFGFEVVFSETAPTEYVKLTDRHSTLTDYPLEKELPSTISKPYYVNNENWFSVVSLVTKNDRVFTSEEKLDEKCKSYLAKMNLNVEYIPVENKPPVGSLFLYLSNETMLEVDNVENANILHYVNREKGDVNYRRYKLNDYLKKNYKVETGYYNRKSNKKYDYVIISDSRNCLQFLYNALENNSFIIYDRTDNWSSLGLTESIEENYVIEKANLIFCSSDYLYETLPEEFKSKAYTVYNGCDVYEYSNVKKYEKKTAVYIGHSSKKLNIQFLNDLAEKNSEWDIVLYGVARPSELNSKIKTFDFIDEKKLFDILCKCHIGLIPFIRSEWTEGMLPLKLFHYVNAHIPTGFVNCDICKKYSDVAFDLNKLTLDEIAEKQDLNFDKYLDSCDWSKRFEQMKDIFQSVKK